MLKDKFMIYSAEVRRVENGWVVAERCWASDARREWVFTDSAELGKWMAKLDVAEFERK